ncbi:MAG: aldehyde ferredoxin oxidoreductase family protein [Nitrososphaerota archaeon]|nr:aldehyde ferredoxin oxidoreductase family protein [Nitrososphaerota archaeon]
MNSKTLTAERWKGITGKLLRIDLTKRKSIVENIPLKWFHKYLGGRGLAARYYYDEISADVDPLSPENKLIFSTGVLTGTPAFGATKAYIVSKSPLTGHYSVANAGGYFGVNLKWAGYDGVIIEGRADEPVYLSIIDGELEIKNAKSYWGSKTIEAQDVIREEVGEQKASVACIGPAGEKLSRMACIVADSSGRRGGVFGRGGLGAVMGSKNLKAIAVYGTKEVEVADVDKLRDYLKTHIKELRETTGNHTRYGTLQYTMPLYELGAYPLLNFTRTRVEEGAMEKLAAEVMRENYLVRDVACSRCPVACGKFLEAGKGEWRGSQSKVEYETLWSLGPHCGVFDYDAIIMAHAITEEYGFDGMSSGYTVGFGMELYERGIIDKEFTGGLELKFGNAEAEIELLELMGERRGVGEVFADGAVRAAERIGKNSINYVMHVKRQEFAGYEPRAFYGIGLAYATSSRGACHNVGGWTIRDELLKPKLDRFAVEGKGRLVKSIQDVRAYIDSLALCTIPRRALNLTDEPSPEVVNYITGAELTGEYLVLAGERIYSLERLILNREGVRRPDDMLPPRIMYEPVPDGPAKGHRITPEMLNKMLDEYYEARGWDRNGVVMEKTIERLEIL